MPHSIYNLTGWHTQASAGNEGFKKSKVKWINGLRVLAYLPLGGIPMGISNIAGEARKSNLSTRVYMVVRGILEILGLGILFLIPDIGVSIHRHLCAKPTMH